MTKDTEDKMQVASDEIDSLRKAMTRSKSKVVMKVLAEAILARRAYQKELYDADPITL